MGNSAYNGVVWTLVVHVRWEARASPGGQRGKDAGVTAVGHGAIGDDVLEIKI
jgi:hypothetical protein